MNEIVTQLKEHGYKLTNQRQIILTILAEHRSLTAEEIFQIGRQNQRLNLSTVYRNLNILQQMNLIRKSNHPEQASHYELVEQNCNHIMKCLKCGKSEILSDCFFRQFVKDIEDRTSFQISYHHLELYGTCPQCRGTL